MAISILRLGSWLALVGGFVWACVLAVAENGPWSMAIFIAAAAGAGTSWAVLYSLADIAEGTSEIRARLQKLDGGET